MYAGRHACIMAFLELISPPVGRYTVKHINTGQSYNSKKNPPGHVWPLLHWVVAPAVRAALTDGLVRAQAVVVSKVSLWIRPCLYQIEYSVLGPMPGHSAIHCYSSSTVTEFLHFNRL